MTDPMTEGETPSQDGGEQDFDVLLEEARRETDRFYAFMNGLEAGIEFMEGDPMDRHEFRDWVREQFRRRVEDRRP